MKTLYLHIGMPKTGTTSIQTFCELNRELLKEMGYWYPESIHKYKNVSIRRNGHFLVGQCKDSEGKRLCQLDVPVAEGIPYEVV